MIYICGTLFEIFIRWIFIHIFLVGRCQNPLSVIIKKLYLFSFAFLTGLNEPRGLSIDWIARRVYITDGNRIVVASLDGKLIYTAISEGMIQPRDISVAPLQGVMFWADWGPAPRIYTAHMDGNRKRPLVLSGLLWPTGLAVDHPALRVYWADPKMGTIESVNFDGKDRHVVHRFTAGKHLYK